ncbi:MAG: hypothetical protein WC753_01545 [Candidatus Gracilibacteria bacterium]
MWRFFDKRVIFIPDTPDGFEFSPLNLRGYRFDGDLVKIPISNCEYSCYDNWLGYFQREDERALVQYTLQKAEEDPQYRGHIQGISLSESVELLRAYYKKQGYEDDLAKNYTLPSTVQITASISLRHALWCEKDKRFLNTVDTAQNPYGKLSPPIRGSHDLRIIQQALRMNIIMGIEVFPGDEKYIDMLVEQEILPPFSISQMIRFRWQKYGWHPRESL